MSLIEGKVSPLLHSQGTPALLHYGCVSPPTPNSPPMPSLCILRLCPCSFPAADLLAQALGSLRSQLRSEGSRGLFLQYGGLGVLLRLLGASSRGGLHGPLDILMQLSAQSRESYVHTHTHTQPHQYSLSTTLARWLLTWKGFPENCRIILLSFSFIIDVNMAQRF